MRQSIKQMVGLIKAQQRAYENRHSRRSARHQPLDFPHWVAGGVKRMEAAGARVSPLYPKQNNGEKALLIDWGTHEIIRTVADFRDEYDREYLSKFGF